MRWIFEIILEEHEMSTPIYQRRLPNMSISNLGVQLDATVDTAGRVEVSVPFPAGTQVVVSVIERAGEDSAELVAAAQSSLDFWDNPLDDEDWNRA